MERVVKKSNKKLSHREQAPLTGESRFLWDSFSVGRRGKNHSCTLMMTFMVVSRFSSMYW